MRIKNKHFVKGFTLIELVIVIAIIALLSGISVFALNNARESGRDAKRRGDLAQIAQGIELYKADCNYYPNSVPAPGSTLTGASSFGCFAPGFPSNRYIEAMPDDPDSAGQDYVYVPLPTTPNCTSTSTCSRFQIWASLENPTTPSYCAPVPPGCGGTCNFCVINP